MLLDQAHGALCLLPLAAQAQNKPNIVFMLADNLGYGDIEPFGSKRHRTPHLTRMAEIAGKLAAAGPFTVRQYRDAAEIGRNVAIEVLEYFDRFGFTRRDGDTRQVVGDPQRLTEVQRGS